MDGETEASVGVLVSLCACNDCIYRSKHEFGIVESFLDISWRESSYSLFASNPILTFTQMQKRLRDPWYLISVVAEAGNNPGVGVAAPGFREHQSITD